MRIGYTLIPAYFIAQSKLPANRGISLYHKFKRTGIDDHRCEPPRFLLTYEQLGKSERSILIV